ncbi:hypothetical protein CONPUDRAFT_142627 [Coniophora puteana RWD-64-598 SS2]|uniref:Uncharacterized protein n=1 Tax=Coniophora puteana (strain RWD-64-598) TaxID=741705 RepID=A0A5M3MYT1_CONPW|nr:uncharacterized protein CONPUDRAFT_142627 [Coniophora puteana RWD-64-598 SS2]EIW84279.1 hypothetical protein CONPUDRAFT_142627 [Coniophora puteana RWD-64-598 SS2]
MMAVDVSFPLPPSQFSVPHSVQVPLRRSSRLAHGAHSIFAHSHSYPSPFPQRRKRQRSDHTLDADDRDSDREVDPLTPRALRALKRARLSPVVDAVSTDLPPQPSIHRTRRRKENVTVEDDIIKRREDTKRHATKRPPSPPHAQQQPATPLSTQRLQSSDKQVFSLPLDTDDDAASHPSKSPPDLSSTKPNSQQSTAVPRSITPALVVVDELMQAVAQDSRSASSCSPLTPLTPSPELIPTQLPHSPPSNTVFDEDSPSGIISPSENDFAMNISESTAATSFTSQSSNVGSFCEASLTEPLSPLLGSSDSLITGPASSETSMDTDNSYSASEEASQRVSSSSAARACREINIWKLACQERVDIMVRRYGPETIKALVAAEATHPDDHHSATSIESSEAPIAGPGPNTTRFRLYTPANYTYGSSSIGGDEEDDDLGYNSTHRSSHEDEIECDYEEEEDDDDYEDFEDDFGDAEMETSGDAIPSVTSNPVSNENAGSTGNTAPDDNSAGHSSIGSENEIPLSEVPAQGHGQESSTGTTRLDLGPDPASCNFSTNFDVPFSAESPSPQFVPPVAQSHTPPQEVPQNLPSSYPDLSSNAAYPQGPSSPHSHFNYRAPQDAALSRFRTPLRVPRLSSLQVAVLSEPPRAFMGRGTPPSKQRAFDWASGSPFDDTSKMGYSRMPVYLHSPSPPPSPSPLSCSASGPNFIQPSSQSELGAAFDLGVNQNPGPGEWTSFLYAMLGNDNGLLPGSSTLTTDTQSGVPMSVQDNPAGSGATWYGMGLGDASAEHAGVAMPPSPIPSEGESSELRFALG